MSFDPQKFSHRTRAAQKIIVVDLGFLGDSIHLIPALWEIKRHYPRAELHTLSATVGSEVLRLAPCVDRAWAFPLGPKSPPWWRHWDVIRALRREKFDLAFNFSGADRTIFLTALTGARWRLAHPGGRQHFWNSWFIREWVPRADTALPVFEQRRQVLGAAGFSLEAPRFDLRADEQAVRWAAETIPAGAIHLSANASTHLKEWPLENSIAMIKQLFRERPEQPVVATGSSRARERERLQKLATAVNNTRFQVLADLSIAQLAALLGRCRLHVGPDSGVIHLAMAMGVPTLSLFRDYAGLAEWLPRGVADRHLTAICACVNRKSPACGNLSAARCLAGISSEAVVSVIREQLAWVP